MKINYDNSKVRRQDRLLEETDAMQLLRLGEYGILSMVELRGNEPAGYGIPINYVWDENGHIYFHCAPEGLKLQILTQNRGVSFCVIGHTNVISHKFTTAYESIIVRGQMCIDLSPEERKSALILLLDKYSPNDKEIGMKYIEKSFHRTNIIRLDIDEISGKTKRVVL